MHYYQPHSSSYQHKSGKRFTLFSSCFELCISIQKKGCITPELNSPQCLLVFRCIQSIFFSSGSTVIHWNLAASHIGGFLELFRHMVGLLGRVTSPSQGLYLHRTAQHRKTRTNIHALSGIRTHDPSNQPVKTHASDRTATVTGIQSNYSYEN
jgi:hypothetical protein